MEKILELKYIKGGKELLFPNDINPIIITDFTYDAKRMGGVPTITASVMYDSCLDNVWDNSVFALFNGEKYFLKQTPTSSKNNTDARFKHEVSLVSERIILDNVYFYDVVSNGEENDKPVSNNSEFSFFGTIHEFARRLHESLKVSHIDYSVIVDDDISSEGELLSFSNTYFSNALQEAYNTFNIPYYFHQKEIHFGYTNNIPEQVFKYGAKDALLSITKTNNNQKLVNRITGVGSADNIPYYYPNLNPAGSAVFETTNIEQSDVKDIDMSKVLSYNKEWEGSEFVLCRKPTEFSYTTDYLHSTDRPNALKPSFQLMVGKGKATGVDGCISGYPLSFTTSDKSGLLMDLCTIQAYELHIEGGMQYLFYLNEVPDLENVGEELGKFQNDIYIGRVANGHTIGKLKEISAEEWIEDGFFPDGYIPCGSNADGTGESVIRWTPLRGNFTTTTKLSGKYVLLMVSRYYIALNMRNRDVIATFAPCYLGEESNDWAYNYLTISAFENSIHAFKYNTDGYVNYEDSGISLVKLSDAPCADITYSVSSDFKINKNISNEETATRIKITGRNYINPMPNLMPSIYRNSLGNERFYNALNETYKNPETGQYYTFNHPYVVGQPKEHIQDFEDIKPTIVGSTNNISWEEGEVVVKQRFDMFAEFAYDVNDNEEIDKETNEYLHPYFFAKLRKMNFNLFDHAIEDGEMTISMTSGTCGGCNFVIGADESLRNPVQVYEEDTTIDGVLHKKGSLKRDAQGNVIASGTPQDIQNNTTDNEVWIALKKEEDTFGVMMPNATHKYYPKSCESDTTNDGDTFVILNIDLPQSYILDAEKRLEEHLIQYMSENNNERFSFSISFSRIYFAENPEVLALINENARLTIEYNGEKHLLYISSYQYKMKGEEHLPEIIVELSDELTVSQNAIQNAVSEVKNEMLYRLGNIDWLAIGQKYFLRKDSTSDTSNAKTNFKKEVTFGSDTVTTKKAGIQPTGDARFNNIDARDITVNNVKATGDATFGEYSTGLTGKGAKIDRQGRSEMRSLRLWESLEVPEIRYNRISINIGFDFDSDGGGIIERVIPDYDENGDILNTGTCTLKLEDGEAGAIAVDDLCMGMWHDEGDKDGNATEDFDDRQGSFTRKGFKTVYFHITEIDEESTNNGTFKYTLRSDGGNGVHPYPQMHFAQRGNPTNKERQAFRYSTTEYTISLCNVDSWTFDSSNIYEIRGKLDGFTMLATNDNGEVYTKSFTGYGQVFGNAYMYGSIDQFDKFNVNLKISQSLNGELAEGEKQTITIGVYANEKDLTDEYTFVVTRSDGTKIAEINGDNPTFTLSYSQLASEHEIFSVVGTHKNSETTIDEIFTVDKLILQEQYMGFWDSTITYMRTRRTFPTITHLGSKWYLVASSDKGTEPLPNSSVWGLMQGSEEMKITFSNSSNFVVLLNNVNTIITLHVMLGFNDITEQILSQPTTILNWSRNSGDTADDYSWQPTIPDLTTGGVIANPTTLEKRNLWLRHDSNHSDLGLKWHTTRTCMFTAQIILPNGDTHEANIEVSL